MAGGVKEFALLEGNAKAEAWTSEGEEMLSFL
jgi:hypothetical protein